MAKMETTNGSMPPSSTASNDEVDFVAVSQHHHHNNNNINDYDINKKENTNNNNTEIVPKTLNTNSKPNQPAQTPNQGLPTKDPKHKRKLFSSSHHTNNNNTTTSEKDDSHKKSSTKERLSLFSFGKRSNSQKEKDFLKQQQKDADKSPQEKSKPITMQCDLPPVPIGTPPRQHKFVKSSSIARLLGNSYHAKKLEKQEQQQAKDAKFHTYGGRRRSSGPYLDRFKRYSKEDGDEVTSPQNAEEMSLTLDAEELSAERRNESGDTLEHFQDNVTTVPMSEERGVRSVRSISRGLGKFWWKRTHSVDISTPDPEFKVSYLGNVLTGWAKGEGCVEKQLNTLWRNYIQNNKPDVIMRIKVCASGLKATTRQHGLTEYWANRITHCCAPKNYPRVFCWIYRHEGRKLKHELRCHAVLCSKEKVVQEICSTLKENLDRALREFKRDKILKQNARLSLANAAYDNPSLPRRKILLSVGGNNYRPPLERSKSAPKLMAIEEAIGEEEGDEIEETNEPEMKPCCQRDSLYPAMTLGRRRCRRGHSIRRTGKTRPVYSVSLDESQRQATNECCHHHSLDTKDISPKANNAQIVEAAVTPKEEEPHRNSYGSDDSDDFDKLLKYNDYDTNATLTRELLPYFDMQLIKNTSSSMGNLSLLKDEEEPLSLLPTINSDPSAHPEGDLLHPPTDNEENCVGLRRNGVCSDGEEDYLEEDDIYFRQASILNMLHRNSMRKMANFSLSSDESSLDTNASNSLQYRHQMQSSISSNASTSTTNSSAAGNPQKQLNPDSDEGSISSGCETASTVTANQDDISLQYRNAKQLQQTRDMLQSSEQADMLENIEPAITAEEVYQRLESRLQRRQNSDATTFSSSSSITLKMNGSSPTESLSGVVAAETRAARRQRRAPQQLDDTDSECSDESGYVEYQERNERSAKEVKAGNEGQQKVKPQLPPKPMPRRLLSTQEQSNKGTGTAV